MACVPPYPSLRLSPSSRRAWVEIGLCWKYPNRNPRFGQNAGGGGSYGGGGRAWGDSVANSKEPKRKPRVALLAEGVGRNGDGALALCRAHESPSSRRAWVEMAELTDPMEQLDVALLAEGVGRNVWMQRRRAR